MKYLKILLILAALGGGAIAISFPVFAHARENARRSSCQSNLKNIGLGYQQYTADYDDRLPLIVSNSKAIIDRFRDAKGLLTTAAPAYGWVDALQPYIKSTCVFRCPSEKSQPSGRNDFTESGLTVYWMNAQVSSVRTKSLRSPGDVFLAGDGDGRDQDTSARYSKSGPPTGAYNDIQPPWTERHLGGANFCYVDGHVKWIRPEDASASPGARDTYSPK